jgi:hypothetical protein
MAALSSKLSLCIASIPLTLRNLRLGLGAFAGRKRFRDIDGFSKGAVRLAAHITFIVFVRLNQFPFAASFLFGGRCSSSQECSSKISLLRRS